jgi:hypothetical protein
VLLQFLQLCPAWFGEFFLQFIPSRDLQRAREIVDIMHNMAVEVFTAKKQALSEGGEAMMSQVGEGKDIMSVLCLYYLLTRLIFTTDSHLNISASERRGR